MCVCVRMCARAHVCFAPLFIINRRLIESRVATPQSQTFSPFLFTRLRHSLAANRLKSQRQGATFITAGSFVFMTVCCRERWRAGGRGWGGLSIDCLWASASTAGCQRIWTRVHHWDASGPPRCWCRKWLRRCFFFLSPPSLLSFVFRHGVLAHKRWWQRLLGFAAVYWLVTASRKINWVNNSR